jgi:hypothetical protein
MSTAFRSTPEGRMISILAFEVANIIVKASNLMKSISEQNIWHLKEGVRGLHCLIAEECSRDRQLPNLIEDEIR